MVYTPELAGTIPLILNQQLFAEAYLRELRATKASMEAIRAAHQTIRDWREHYTNLDSASHMRQYTNQCLASLGLAYSIHPDGYILFGDDTLSQPVGLCLIVADPDLGRATKGRHHQFYLIKKLRQHSLQWGIITNGKDWRLCHAASPAPYEVFLQADLDRLLSQHDLTDFALFCRFFSSSAFTPSTSPTTSTTTPVSCIGMDAHLEESDKRVEAIQRHLRARVEPILQSLCLGFVQDEAALTYNRDTLDEIYRNSIYLLYRILFLFYGEGRELMPIRDPRYRDVSLAAILEDARRHQQEGTQDPDRFSLWKRLTHLCVIVDDGDESLGVRPYNGGLFSDTEKPYLKAHKIANSYLAPALFELGYVQTKHGVDPIDYRDLAVRQLGTLYEGLLEFKLNLVGQEPVVVRESGGKRLFIPESQAGPIKKTEIILEVGQAYFADDKGERKQSGSYYTPEDVVRYIVTNTVGPKLHERRAPLDKLIEQARTEKSIAAGEEERVRIELYADHKLLEMVESDILGLRILDPAMGSAHFLVSAGQLITNAIVEALNSADWPNDDLTTDPLVWKRRVVERCLYGVDLNPLAQELAKLALWITSASVGKPLTFLDHHLKVGNSLYGAPLARLSTLPTFKKTPNTNDIWQSLREQTIASVLEEIGRITHTDSDRIEDVKYKGEANRTAESFLQRLKDLANVWLATLFGLEGSNGGLVEHSEYFALLEDVTRNYAPETWERKVETTSVLYNARRIADHDHESYFHWELEFPDAVVEGTCRFDAIVANPPYVGTSPNKVITALYETAKCGDLYAWFLELALRLSGDNGGVGTVVPLSLMFSRQISSLRATILKYDGEAWYANFDNRPDVLFRPPGHSEAKENRQRCTVVLISKKRGVQRYHTTNLLRWARDERPHLFRELRYAEFTPFAKAEIFPKLGDSALAEFWDRLSYNTRTVGSIAKVIAADDNQHGDFMLHIAGAAMYFITAMPDAMRTTGTQYVLLSEFVAP